MAGRPPCHLPAPIGSHGTHKTRWVSQLALHRLDEMTVDRDVVLRRETHWGGGYLDRLRRWGRKWFFIMVANN